LVSRSAAKTRLLKRLTEVSVTSLSGNELRRPIHITAQCDKQPAAKEGGIVVCDCWLLRTGIDGVEFRCVQRRVKHMTCTDTRRLSTSLISTRRWLMTATAMLTVRL